METCTLDNPGEGAAQPADTLPKGLDSVLDDSDSCTEEPVEFALDADGQVVHEMTAIDHHRVRALRRLS